MKKVYRSTQELVDSNTGEIIKTNSINIYQKKLPAFARVFYNDIGCLFDLTSSTKDVLWMIILRMNTENKITLDQDEVTTLSKLSKKLYDNTSVLPQKPFFEIPNNEKKKVEVTEEFAGYTERVIRKAIDSLYLRGILIRINKGKYLIHPNIATKATDKDIEMARITLEYDTDGNRYLVTEFKMK